MNADPAPPCGPGVRAVPPATGAQFLVRPNANRRPPVLARLPDASFVSVIGGVKVRVIAASVIGTCHDGTRYGGDYRVATTLLDHRACPAASMPSGEAFPRTQRTAATTSSCGTG